MREPVIRVGVVSDTHAGRPSALPKGLLEALDRVDLILHAGDITSRAVLERLERLAPVAAVYGNCDPPELRSLLPARRIIAIGGRRIGLWHGSGRPTGLADRAQEQFREERVEVIVFGHSHCPWNQWEGAVLRFNPGNASQPRFTGASTCGILTIGESVESALIPCT